MSPHEWLLWGCHPSYGPTPIKLTGGTLARCRREQRSRIRDGAWTLWIRPVGDPRPNPDDYAKETRS